MPPEPRAARRPSWRRPRRSPCRRRAPAVAVPGAGRADFGGTSSPTGVDLAGRREAPVEQAGRPPCRPRGSRSDVRVHDRDEQHLAVALGDTGEGGARVGGVAVLDARDALVRGDAVVAGQQPVGVLDLEGLALLALGFCSPGNLARRRRAVLAEVLLLQPAAGDERQVVRGGDLAGGVVAVGRDHVRVEGLELLGVLLHVLRRSWRRRRSSRTARARRRCRSAGRRRATGRGRCRSGSP